MKASALILFLFALAACSDSSRKAPPQPGTGLHHAPLMPEARNADDSLKKILSLPSHALSRRQIDSIVAATDKYIATGKWRLESSYGANGEPCEIVRYYKDSILVRMDRGCGDCSPVMSQEKHYILDNSLVFVLRYTVDYGYNPCWQEKELKEFGVTEKYKRDHLRQRWEKYYLLDLIHYVYERSGNLNDTTYVDNDTLPPAALLNTAAGFLNAKDKIAGNETN